MTNPNGAKGAETERMVARYLRPWWPEVDRRLREGRADDQGDLDGIPLTCVQVKYVAKPALQSWITATLKQRDTKGCPLALLVVRRKYKPVAEWDAYMPGQQLGWSHMDEREAAGWMRMDLSAAAGLLEYLVTPYAPLPPSSPTTA